MSRSGPLMLEINEDREVARCWGLYNFGCGQTYWKNMVLVGNHLKPVEGFVAPLQQTDTAANFTCSTQRIATRTQRASSFVLFPPM